MIDFNKKIERAFELLNDRLKENESTLTVICAGGYVLSYYGVRTTKDVDGFFRSAEAINKAIRDVGDILDLNTDDELWLNNSVQNLNDCPPSNLCRPVYEYSNLCVLMPPLEYIAGMKLQSARAQDIQDVAEMIKLLKSQDPLSFAEELEHFGFSSIDTSLVMESFGMAYGMSWLEEYYMEHEKDILAKL